jgi:hypothetical protein
MPEINKLFFSQLEQGIVDGMQTSPGYHADFYDLFSYNFEELHDNEVSTRLKYTREAMISYCLARKQYQHR